MLAPFDNGWLMGGWLMGGTSVRAKELTDSIIDFADKGVESTLAVAGSIVHAARPMTGGTRVLAIAAANRAIPPSEQIAVV